MSKKSGSPDFNRHQSFAAAIGAQNKNLSSMKLPHRSGTALEVQVEADEDALLLSIPKGPLQGRQVVINQNAPHSREKKMIQLRKHYVQSVKQFFDASPARRITDDINKGNFVIDTTKQNFKHKSTQNINKSQLMRPSSAANKLSHSNARAITSFLQNREVTLANQISLTDASTLQSYPNDLRLLQGNGMRSMSNLFSNKSQQQIQFSPQPIQYLDDNSQQQYSSLMQVPQAYDADQQDWMIQQLMPQLNRNFSLNNIVPPRSIGNNSRHQNNYENVETMPPSNSMMNLLSHSQLISAQQQLQTVPSSGSIYDNKTTSGGGDRFQRYETQQQQNSQYNKNSQVTIDAFQQKQNLNDTGVKLLPQEYQYGQQSTLLNLQQIGNQPLSNEEFEREETSNQDNNIGYLNNPILDFYNHINLQGAAAFPTVDSNDFCGSSPLHYVHPEMMHSKLTRQYSETSITAEKQQFFQQYIAPKIPRAPTRHQNVMSHNKLSIQGQTISEEVNFEIDPHILMMSRQQPPYDSDLLELDDEIQTSSPQYQNEGGHHNEEFINYQQENNNLIYQSTTAAVAVVEPFQENQRKNSNYHDQRATQLRDQQDTMQQQQQYQATINAAGNNDHPSLLGGGPPNNFSSQFPGQQQQTSSQVKSNSQQNQQNNRNLVNLAGQPPSTIIKPPLSFAQNANIPPISTAATAATHVGQLNHQTMGNSSHMQMQNGLPAAGGGNGNGGGVQLSNNNMAAGGARGDNRFSGGGGGGIGGVINSQQPSQGQQQPRVGGLQLQQHGNQFQQSFPPTSVTPQAYQNMMGGSHSGFTSSSSLPLLKDAKQGQNGRVRSLNQRIEYHLEGSNHVPNQQSLVNINTSQYKGHQEVQQKQSSFINKQGPAFVDQPGQPQYYQQQPLLKQLPNQQSSAPILNGAGPGQFQNSSQKQMSSQFGGANPPIGQNNGGFYYPKKMKQLRRRIPDLHVSGSSDSLPQQQFEAPRSNFNSYQQSASTLDPAQLHMNFSQDSRGTQVYDPL